MSDVLLDSHLHLLFPDRFDYYWWRPGFGLTPGVYGPEIARETLSGAGIGEALVVQAHPSVEETCHLLSLARRHPFIRGVVAWINLADPRIEDRLAGLDAEPLVKAVRHQTGEDEQPDWFDRPEIRRGLRALGRTRLPWDLLCRPQHLPAAVEALERVPGFTVVLEHLGKPPIASGHLEPWAADLRRIARVPGVSAKVSELSLQAGRTRGAPSDLRPWLEAALDCFGFDRLMWGSGWPVCLAASPYRLTLDAVLTAIGPIDENDRTALLGGTARRVYGLEVSP